MSYLRIQISKIIVLSKQIAELAQYEKLDFDLMGITQHHNNIISFISDGLKLTVEYFGVVAVKPDAKIMKMPASCVSRYFSSENCH